MIGTLIEKEPPLYSVVIKNGCRPEKILSASKNKFNYEPGRTTPADYTNYPFEDYMPAFPDVKWPGKSSTLSPALLTG